MARMKSHRIRRLGAIAGAVMVAPYLILMILFGILPIIMAFVTSMRGSLQNPAGGLGNYLLVIEDFRFWPAVVNVTTFLAIYVPLMVVAVAAMALLLDTVRSKWNVSLRTAYIVPASISGSVAILVWYFMLEPTYSPFGDLLRGVGITSGVQMWSQSNLTIIFVAMAFATGAGNWIIIQYGSLQSISDDILEAARIDGANAWQVGLQIKLPLIRKYLIYMAILTFAAGLQIFVEPQLISGSVYPGLANNWSLNQLSYTFAFSQANLGAASALSLMLLIVCVIAALFVIFKTDFFEESGVIKKSKSVRGGRK